MAQPKAYESDELAEIYEEQDAEFDEALKELGEEYSAKSEEELDEDQEC